MEPQRPSEAWYVARDGKQHGPISSIEFRALIERGLLRPIDLVWRDGFPEWLEARSLPEFKANGSVPPTHLEQQARPVLHQDRTNPAPTSVPAGLPNSRPDAPILWPQSNGSPSAGSLPSPLKRVFDQPAAPQRATMADGRSVRKQPQRNSNQQAGAIFLSYRRDDSAPWAGRIYERLSQDFEKHQLFMDIDNIAPGHDFSQILDEKVATSEVFLCVIGPNWTAAKNSRGGRRLDDPNDFVRIEAESALGRGKLVIPVLVDGARMPAAEDLPKGMKALSMRNAFEVTHARFGRDMAALIEALTGVARKPSASGSRPPASWYEMWRGLGEVVLVTLLLLAIAATFRSGPSGELLEVFVPSALACLIILGLVRRYRAVAPNVVLSAFAGVAARLCVDLGFPIFRVSAEVYWGFPIVIFCGTLWFFLLRAYAPAIPESSRKRTPVATLAVVALLISGGIYFGYRQIEASNRAVAMAAEASNRAAAKAAEASNRAAAKAAEAELRDAIAAANASSNIEHNFRDCTDLCPEMVVVPAGEFTMGCSKDLINNCGPFHTVAIRRPFAVGKFEVTFAEWDACAAAGGCATNKSPNDRGWGRGRRPVINVSWIEAKEYVAWLSRYTGQSYRLLSEAEWEYAARAGTETKYSFGNKVAKTHAQFSASKTAEVGQFPVNLFGLYDMHGNVAEWVEDGWHYYSYQGAPSDGSVWRGGDPNYHIARGGSWVTGEDGLASYARQQTIPDPAAVGFRVARTL
jgi:formylglycine-generating enzyme required for sulfatase activity